MFNKLIAVMATCLLSFSANFAFAVVDTTAAVAEIAGNNTAISAVGGALIALAALALGYKWVKGTIFS